MPGDEGRRIDRQCAVTHPLLESTDRRRGERPVAISLRRPKRESSRNLLRIVFASPSIRLRSDLCVAKSLERQPAFPRTQLLDLETSSNTGLESLCATGS